MMLNSSRGPINVDEKKYQFMVLYEAWNFRHQRYETCVAKRTNNRKVAEKALKDIIHDHAQPTPDWLLEIDPDAGKYPSKNERIIEQ